MTAIAGEAPRQFSGALYGRLILALLGAGFAGLLVVVITALWLISRNQDYSGWVDHTYQVENQTADFRVLFERAEAGRRGYLIGGESFYRDVFDGAVGQLPGAMEALAQATADNPRQGERIARLRPLVRGLIVQMKISVDRARGGDLASGREAFLLERNSTQVAAVRDVLNDMTQEENSLLKQRTQRQLGNTRLLGEVVVAAAVLLALVALGSFAVMRRYARDLLRSRDALWRLNEGLEAAVGERTADLTRANDEIQRFAYIVSHDLRSPLVNVMGFTSELELAAGPLKTLVAAAQEKAPEIVTDAARAAVMTDLPEAIGFIRASTQKMDRLIAAILQLSRQGRRTLRPERIAVGEVVEAIVATMRHQIGERGAEIVVEGSLPELVSDRLAIEQILSNLIENGVKYLQPGRPGRVVVRGFEAGGRVTYEVQDNGRGVDPKDHERIFELFRRSGPQDQPGEGIGLAHVRALAYRLGGAVTCESGLDQGATFRLSLPRNLSQNEGIAA